VEQAAVALLILLDECLSTAAALVARVCGTTLVPHFQDRSIIEMTEKLAVTSSRHLLQRHLVIAATNAAARLLLKSPTTFTPEGR